MALREWLSTQIENYFKGDAPLSEKDFDIFHKKLCKTIVEWFKGNLDQGKKATFTYGKAQKLVNMTFKNMYCYEAVADKIAHFRFCHIPIDSYIIDAFKKRNIEGPKDEDKDTRDVVWSKMNLKAYDDYTNRLRASVKEQYGEDMFPLQAEFIIWSEQKEAKAKEEHVKWEKNHRDKVNAKIDEIKKLSVKEDECY